MGREEGIEHSIIAIARKRFGTSAINPHLEAAIRALRIPALAQLLDELLDLEDAATFSNRVLELSR